MRPLAIIETVGHNTFSLQNMKHITYLLLLILNLQLSSIAQITLDASDILAIEEYTEFPKSNAIWSEYDIYYQGFDPEFN